jgi:hypothetical protein
MSKQQSFRDFCTGLERRFGPEVLDVRHELYFTARRNGRWVPKVFQGARAIAALGVTVFDLMMRPGPRRIAGKIDGFLVASLPGSNGWQALRPFLRQTQAEGMSVASLWHPRLGRQDPAGETAVYWLPRPSFAELISAIGRSLPLLGKHHDRVGSIAAMAIVVRGLLWRAAWRRLARLHPAALALHNDFDLMGAAATDCGLPTMVLQHGVPTDEFFPPRAEVLAVWGATSAAAFQATGARFLEDGLGRLEAAASPSTEKPGEIILLSQTHTDLYGDDLRGALIGWEAALEARRLPFSVWLHPAEGPAPGPYRRAIAAPHPDLTQIDGSPKLVIGYASTALLDAALAGHYVVGLDGDLPGSLAAQSVARPPVRVADIESLVLLWSELQSSEGARAKAADAGQQWIAQSFAPTGIALAEWVRMAARCSRS